MIVANSMLATMTSYRIDGSFGDTPTRGHSRLLVAAPRFHVRAVEQRAPPISTLGCSEVVLRVQGADRDGTLHQLDSLAVIANEVAE